MANSAEEWVSLSEFARRRGVALFAVQKAIASGRVTAVRRDDTGRLVGIEVAAATMQWDMNTDPVEAAKSGKVLGQVTRASSAAIAMPATEHPPERAADASRGNEAARSDLFPEGHARSCESINGTADTAPFPAVPREPGADARIPPEAGEGTSAVAVVQTPAPAIPDKDPHGYYEARARREQFQSKQAELDYLQALGELVSSAEMRRISARRYRAIRDKLLNISDRLAAVLAAERDPAQVHAILTADIKRVLNELSDDASAELAGGVAERVAA